MTADALSDEFLQAGVWHGSLDRAEALIAEHPGIAVSNIYTAAVVGDAAAVVRWLAADPGIATAPGGPFHWDPLTYLCFSRFLRLDPARSPEFVRAATALLDAGANPNTGFFDPSHMPEPMWESALYGAAGVAHHPEMTRLLLDRGADPNDGETPYHAPETYDNEALQIVVRSGKLDEDSLATMLLRKADWHDLAGIRWLLEHGARPNHMTCWGYTALQQAVRRDNGRSILEAMIDHGGDPLLANRCDGRSAVAMAACRGRGDLLELFEHRGVPIELQGVDGLLAACARNDSSTVRSLAKSPELLRETMAVGGTTLADFAGVGNTDGVRQLLDLGLDVNATVGRGDGYWDVTDDSTALHVAAWRARHDTVQLLIDRGAAIDCRDGLGRTPLMLAVRASVDSFWTELRSPQSVEALLRAGADASGVAVPCGYSEIDQLLELHGRPGPFPR